MLIHEHMCYTTLQLYDFVSWKREQPFWADFFGTIRLQAHTRREPQMNEKTIDLLFKSLAAGLLPAMFWINTQSVEIAVLSDQVKSNIKELQEIRKEQRSLRDHQKETEAVLRELGVTMGFIKDLVTEIKNELKSR